MTLRVANTAPSVEIEMPAVTTGKYAAKRAAEELGLDPDIDWRLIRIKNNKFVDPDESVAALNGERVYVGAWVEV